jgi:hypothetical protein
MDVHQAAKVLVAARARIVSTCQECGAPIAGTRRRRYCSVRCNSRAWRRARREAAASPVGAADVPPLSPPAMRRCASCGAPLRATHAKRRFCSAACRQRAYRGRRTSKPAADPAIVTIGPAKPGAPNRLVERGRQALDGRRQQIAALTAVADRPETHLAVAQRHIDESVAILDSIRSEKEGQAR